MTKIHNKNPKSGDENTAIKCHSHMTKTPQRKCHSQMTKTPQRKFIGRGLKPQRKSILW